MSKQPPLAANSLAPIRLAYANERFRLPDGRLLIENNNLVELLPRWQPAFVTERDGNFAIDRSCFDPRGSCVNPRGRYWGLAPRARRDAA
jgi:hypothetical protein